MELNEYENQMKKELMPIKIYAQCNYDFFIAILSLFDLDDFLNKEFLKGSFSLFDLGFNNVVSGLENSCLSSLFENSNAIECDEETRDLIQKLPYDKRLISKENLLKRRGMTIHSKNCMNYLTLIMDSFRHSKVGINNRSRQSYYSYAYQTETFDLFLDSMIRKYSYTFKLNQDQFVEFLFINRRNDDTNLFLFNALVINAILQGDVIISGFLRTESRYRRFRGEGLDAPYYMSEVACQVQESFNFAQRKCPLKLNEKTGDVFEKKTGDKIAYFKPGNMPYKYLRELINNYPNWLKCTKIIESIGSVTGWSESLAASRSTQIKKEIKSDYPRAAKYIESNKGAVRIFSIG